MLTVRQLIIELEERDPEAIARVRGGDITEIEVLDNGTVYITGEDDGT